MLRSVARLSASDYRGALEVLGEAGASDGVFSEPALEALRRLVPCDVVAYHEEETLGGPAMAFAGEPCAPMTDEIRGAALRYRHQDPIPPVRGARKSSDLVDLREYRRSELYQLADRPLGIKYLMRLWLEPGVSGARFEFDRSRRDFGERDRAVLDLLLPHLVRLRRRVRRSVDAALRLTPREREVLELVAQGRRNTEVASLLNISADTVRKHLENAYAELGVHTRTEAVAAVFGPQLPLAGL